MPLPPSPIPGPSLSQILGEGRVPQLPSLGVGRGEALVIFQRRGEGVRA
jgi:hypothetical protein